jgi:hypothetical protein
MFIFGSGPANSRRQIANQLAHNNHCMVMVIVVVMMMPTAMVIRLCVSRSREEGDESEHQ